MKTKRREDTLSVKELNVETKFSKSGVELTATGAEMNVLTGVTPGTVAAGKAVVADANKDVATFRHITLSGNLVSGSTTLSEADLALVDGLNAGVATASKALVAGAAKQIPAGLVENVETKNADFTLTANDSFKTFIITDVDKVASLPATAAGLRYTFIIAAAALSGGTGFSINPVAADKIMGPGITSADNKDLINTGATDAEGDLITLVGDGVHGWYVTAKNGTWDREA